MVGGLVAQPFAGVFLFNQLDFVTVRIFHEGDNGAAAFYRPGFAGTLPPFWRIRSQASAALSTLSAM